MKEQIKKLNQTQMGERIRARREELKMTREQLSEKLDVSPKFIGDVEYGLKGMSIKNLYLLSQILDISTDYLLGNDDFAELAGAPIDIFLKLKIIVRHKPAQKNATG